MKALLVATSLVFLVTAASVMAAEKDDFDRLDGRGPSGVKVDVIEWEGNLEIHVYPAGALQGLAMKLDQRNKNKPVMVIGYRFSNAPKSQLIRRAILGIPLREGFKAYRDPSAGSEYDKIIISNHQLSSLASFKLDPEPTQLYPDGHPMLAQTEPQEKPSRKPSSKARTRSPEQRGTQDEDGKIQNFSW